MLNDNMPLISAIVTVYNTPAELLRKSVKSILKQMYKNIEIIIVDNASSAVESRKMIADLKEHNEEQIHIVSLERNLGPGQTVRKPDMA